MKAAFDCKACLKKGSKTAMLYLYLILFVVAWGSVLLRAILRIRNAKKKEPDNEHHLNE
jgi:hypothetical protein